MGVLTSPVAHNYCRERSSVKNVPSLAWCHFLRFASCFSLCLRCIRCFRVLDIPGQCDSLQYACVFNTQACFEIGSGYRPAISEYFPGSVEDYTCTGGRRDVLNTESGGGYGRPTHPNSECWPSGRYPPDAFQMHHSYRPWLTARPPPVLPLRYW